LPFNFGNFAFFAVNMVYIMTETMLVKQAKGKELEYHIIAVSEIEPATANCTWINISV